ncbi:hypothetical protein [Parabacteroides timonensis]|uniref:hypothetical protein n=1 Tax=Parabacteroides timonensis TaxID=1871013 RepID=UPI00094EF9BE|nr:hypothetical protein [Parabacteroides timonensis]
MLTDFYTVETVAGQDEGYTCVIRLNPEHNVYKGHFPGMPVVPGVCMLRIVKECVSMMLNTPVRFQAINSCKFLSVVNPLEHGILTFAFSLGNTNRLQAIASAGETTVLKLKATIVAE